METTTELKMPGTPKPWMNRAMRTMMRVPGLRGLLGKTLAVITVTGAKSGREYSTPVQYMKSNGDYVVLSQKHRIWWRNIRSRPEVSLDVGGTAVRCLAEIPEGPDAQRMLSTCLIRNPRVAKFYGITPNDQGFEPADIERLANRLVPIVLSPDTSK